MLTLASALLACTQEAPQKGPDVFLVVVDTLRADSLGYAGQPLPTSPNTDALARDGQWFSRAHASSSWTLPSTATLMTGEWPWEHRAVADALDVGTYGKLPPGSETLAETLQGRGYRTGAWVNNTYLAPEFGFDQGFQTYDYQGADGDASYRSAQDTVDLALAFLDAEEGPVFGWLHFMEPHHAYAPDAACKGRFSSGIDSDLELPLSHEQYTELLKGKRPSEADVAWLEATYLEEVCTADNALGSFLDGLKERGRYEDAWIVFTSDHGEEFWEYGRFGHGHQLRSVLTNVPPVVKGPGVPPGRNDSVVHHVELVQALREAQGPFFELLREGATVEGRAAWSAAPNREMGQVSVITETERLLVFSEFGTGLLQSLDPRGWEEDVLTSYNNRDAARAAPLFPRLLEACPEPFTPLLPSKWRRMTGAEEGGEAWMQLRALGYVD